MTSVISACLEALNVAPICLSSDSGSSLFFSFRDASRPLPQQPLTMDRGSPPVFIKMYACQASLSVASMMCVLVMAAASIALSPCPSQCSREVGVTGPENSSGVVVPVVVPVASELFDLDFLSHEEPLLLFCPFQRCCDACLSGSENNSDVVAPSVISVASADLDPDFFPVRNFCRCCGCCWFFFCCAASLGWCTCAVNAVILSSSVMLRERCAVAACCCGPCGSSKPTLRYDASGEPEMTLFCGHLSERVCVEMIVL